MENPHQNEQNSLAESAPKREGRRPPKSLGRVAQALLVNLNPAVLNEPMEGS